MLRELIGKVFGIWEVVKLFEGRKVVELVIVPTINLLIDELTINLFDDSDEVVVICEFLEWKKYTFNKDNFDIYEIINYIISEIEKEREVIEQEFIKSFKGLK
jgi:hypothetical protein